MEESRALTTLTDNAAEKLNGEGLKHEKAGEYTKAMECYREAARLGSARGWTNLGVLYYSGKCGAKDKREAYECFLKASDGGHERGMFYLAGMLARGNGVKANIEEALRLFKFLMGKKYEGAKQEYEKLRSFFPDIEVPETDEEKARSNPHFQSSVQVIPLDEITFGDKLGEGAFGEVFHGQWQGADVAIKKLAVGVITGRDLKKEFEGEAALMFQLRSPRIIGFLGINFQQPCIVMEYASLGNVSDFLKKHPTSWTVRINGIAVDIALGVGYLHGKNVFHRDLKAKNILVDSVNGKVCAKISDFGLAKLKEGGNTTRINPNARVLGSTAWLAPEVAKKESGHTRKSDVFSMGVTFWELATKKEPLERCGHSEMELRSTWADRETIPDRIPDILKQEIKKCWALNPADRPDAYAVAKALKEYKGEQDGTEEEPLSPPDSPTLDDAGYVYTAGDPAAGYAIPSGLGYSAALSGGPAENLARYRLKPDNGGSEVGKNNNNATTGSGNTRLSSSRGAK